ncbi:MAG: DNA alkylation repair protein [Muribaculaceae bacterium]|nr:DNA alkylation repair protein [Muribaculaceae bacterium]
MPISDTLQTLRQAFFAYRNGVVAEALRRGGDPHEFVMGCQLADLMAITSAVAHDAALAQALWDDRRHRECRLAAAMVYPADAMTADTALRWATDVQCTEEADVLCHRLLRHVPCAAMLWRELVTSEQPLQQYTALRLLLNLLILGRENDHQTIHNLLHHTPFHPTPALTALLAQVKEELHNAAPHAG